MKNVPKFFDATTLKHYDRVVSTDLWLSPSEFLLKIPKFLQYNGRTVTFVPHQGSSLAAKLFKIDDQCLQSLRTTTYASNAHLPDPDLRRDQLSDSASLDEQCFQVRLAISPCASYFDHSFRTILAYQCLANGLALLEQSICHDPMRMAFLSFVT